MKDYNILKYKLENNEEKDNIKMLKKEDKLIIQNEKKSNKEFKELPGKISLKDIKPDKFSKNDKKIINQQLYDEWMRIKLDKLQLQYNMNIQSTDVRVYNDDNLNNDISDEYLKLKSNLKSIINNNSDIQLIANYFNN